MENRDLILKAVEYVNDIPARVDEFLKMQKEEIKEPEFKVGQWVIWSGCHHAIGRIIREKKNNCYALEVNGDRTTHDSCHFSKLRLATKEEIEAHLREVCYAKGLMKEGIKLKDANDEVLSISKGCYFEYRHTYDSFVVSSEGIKNDFKVTNLYYKGKFAEIVPNKKQLPKTKEEFRDLLRKFQDDALLPFPTMDVDDFLNQYKD